MNVNKKLRLLLLFLLIAYSFALLTVRQYQAHGIAAFQQNREEEVSRLFDKLVEMRSKTLSMLASDYACWDELVEFVDSGDTEWARGNIEPAFPAFDIQAAWVFKPDFSLTYFHSDIQGMTADQLESEWLRQVFSSSRTTHFAVMTPQGLVEVRGVAVNYTRSKQNQEQAQGYFAVGRLWDKAKVEEFEPLIRGKITLLPAGGISEGTVEATDNAGGLVVTRQVPGWDNQPVATLRAVIPAQIIADYFRQSNRNFFYLALLLLMLFSGFAIVLILWVDRPLRRIAESLRDESVQPLGRLLSLNNEFGNIARLIHGFFSQKSELVREVAERQRAEEALRKNEQRFRKYFDLPLTGISVISADKKWVDANEKMCDILKYSREELLNTGWLEVTAPEDRARQEEMHEQIEAGERDGYTVEKRFVCKDGTIICCKVSLMCVRNDDGNVEYFVAVADDITERKRAEDALLFTQFAIDHAAESMFWVHRDGRIYNVNEAACRILGYSRSELLGMTVFDVGPQYGTDTWDRYWDDMRKLRSFTFESVMKGKEDKLFPIEATVNLLEFKNEQYCFVFTRDITERKQGEKDRAHLEEQLRQAQKMESIGRLAGGVAHDFNNLLSPIIGYSDLILSQLTPDDKIYNDVRQILDAAERCGSLTKQLLAFSRKQVLHMRVLDLNEVVLGFEKMLRRLIGEDVELQVRAVPHIERVKADQSQIEQVLMNLAINARDAMPGGGALLIETGMAELDEFYAKTHTGVIPGRYAVFSVSDTGQGMEAEVRSRLFEPFFTTKEHGKGTGLGLATVYGIIKQHGGHIWVYSETGRGTTFKLYFPVAVEDTDPVTQEAPLGNYEGTETVLVVEDETSVRQLVEDVLTVHGYNVLSASNPQDALQTVLSADTKIDLLLTDVIMPQMNGKELYERVLPSIPQIKVLYMSGYTGDTILSYGIKDEEYIFLQKPFSVHGLMVKVRQVLDRVA